MGYILALKLATSVHRIKPCESPCVIRMCFSWLAATFNRHKCYMSDIIKGFLVQCQKITLSSSPQGDAPPSHTHATDPRWSASVTLRWHACIWDKATGAWCTSAVQVELFCCHCARFFRWHLQDAIGNSWASDTYLLSSKKPILGKWFFSNTPQRYIPRNLVDLGY